MVPGNGFQNHLQGRVREAYPPSIGLIQTWTAKVKHWANIGKTLHDHLFVPLLTALALGLVPLLRWRPFAAAAKISWALDFWVNFLVVSAFELAVSVPVSLLSLVLTAKSMGFGLFLWSNGRTSRSCNNLCSSQEQASLLRWPAWPSPPVNTRANEVLIDSMPELHHIDGARMKLDPFSHLLRKIRRHNRNWSPSEMRRSWIMSLTKELSSIPWKLSISDPTSLKISISVCPVVDCVPISLFEIEELARLMRQRDTDVDIVDDEAKILSAVDPPCPSMVMLCTETKAEINAGLVIVTSCRRKRPFTLQDSATDMVLGLLASRRNYWGGQSEHGQDNTQIVLPKTGLAWLPLLPLAFAFAFGAMALPLKRFLA